MAPEIIRKDRGFAGLARRPATATAIALLLTRPTFAAPELDTAAVGGAVPLALAAGACVFALIAVAALRNARRNSLAVRERAGTQIAGLRALVDEYEGLLAGTRELTILWPEGGAEPKFLGQAGAVLPPGRRPEAALNLYAWLKETDADALARALEELRVSGHAFDIGVTTLEGRRVRATGWLLGGATAMRLKPSLRQRAEDAPAADAGDEASIRALIALVGEPAFIRDDKGGVVHANQAYLQLAGRIRRTAAEGELPDLVGNAQGLIAFGDGERYELVDIALGNGRAFSLKPIRVRAEPKIETDLTAIHGVIDALSTPIAIFNAARELTQFNRAYADLWGLDPKWLQLGMDERSILDRLRTEGMLPSEPDYHAWRAGHLKSYELKVPRESEPWHLPDGRTIKVIAAPAGPKGGVIYIFEDITARLKLESLNKALSSVQRETLNALSEGVAVFGTNGRLTLSNPRLSVLWKLPMNELGHNPHIDAIAEACARVMPEDGAIIWRDLKRRIVDLNPTRSDTTGRITRADGRLLDYAVTRLPDGQTMMTFLDVTESANYNRVLKERNDALVTADKLKDAFVQNVSYELRSPLTNIIGFADLLASNEVGTLNERQRAYTDYIRASSVTLGVLIDNILDLATVDAGIAELRPQLQDVPGLVEKARAGLAATFPQISGEKPLNVVIDVPEHLPPFLADGTRIVQVLYNLLSNAARFSEPGGEIRLSVAARADRMLFIVEDEGPGMSEEMQAAMTESIETASGRQRGAGLGLAIVRSFVNLHGGTITIENRKPRGTRVIVNLPRLAAFAATGAAE